MDEAEIIERRVGELWDYSNPAHSPGLFAATMAATTEAIVITDADLESPGPRILFVNPAFTKMTGYTEEEVVGKSPRVLQGTKTDRAVLRRLRNSLRRGETFEGEVINYRKDGSEFHLEWQISPLRNASGEVTNYVSFQRDITARKKAEQQLAESEERYRTLIERSPDAIFVHCDGKIVFANPAAAALLGAAQPEAILGLDVREVVHPDSQAAVRERLQQPVAGGQATLLEQKFVRRDGAVIDVEAVAIAINYAGRPAVQVIAHDLTEKKRLAEQTSRGQRIESLGMLATGIAHDLNNVLAPILMAVPVLRDGATDPAHLSLLADVERSAARGAAFVRQILGFAHGVGGKPQLMSLAPLLHDMVSIASKTFSKSIQIDLKVGVGLWPVKAQPAQIHQVLLNLCVNARDAMPEGGSLELKAENCVLDEEGARSIEGASPGRWVAIHVTDSGTGIASEVLTRMWDPFFSTKPLDRGTGLGLSTVRGIVKEHFGFVAVQTSPGCGTTFRVFLPAAEGTVFNEPASVVAPRGNGELVLVVDDEPSIRIAASAILLRQGYHVLASSDGKEAMALFEPRNHEIRLVLTDLDMPKLTGEVLAKRIRKLNPAVKLIAMSGADRDIDGVPHHHQFADGFLLKPFAVEHMLSLVHQLLHPE